MKIVLTKGKTRNTMTCMRQDGSSTSVNLSTNVPNHDFAHFIVENKFKLKESFFGNIKAGKNQRNRGSKNGLWRCKRNETGF